MNWTMINTKEYCCEKGSVKLIGCTWKAYNADDVRIDNTGHMSKEDAMKMVEKEAEHD